jgi:TatD DNase family protein
MLVDSHCHLDFPELMNDIDGVIARAKEAGVARILTISTLISRYEIYKNIAERYEEVFFSIGTHPNQALEEPETNIDTLIQLAQHPRCIAIGEAGLDFYYDRAPINIQINVFKAHIEAARRSGLPLIIHARNADEIMLATLESEIKKEAFKAVLHCYSSGSLLAEQAVELGLYISFSGIITFKKSDELRAIAENVPLDRLLVETDAPYLAPHPHRGKSNEPSYTIFTAQTLATIKNITYEEIEKQTTNNFFTLFNKANQ